MLLDPGYYDAWAKRILAGDFLGEGVFYGLPLYPYFLALCYKLGGVSVMFVKVIQALLGTLTVYFIYRIGHKISSDEKIGLAAAGLAAAYGPLFFHETMLIPEALSLPLYAWAFLAALDLFESPSVRKGLFFGVIAALAALTKAGIILTAVLILAVLLIQKRESAGRPAASAAAGLLSFFLVLSPVTAHNVLHGKDWVPLTSHSGFNFFIGNNPEAEGVFMSPKGVGTNVDSQKEDSRAYAERELGRKLKPSEVSRYWSDRAWNFIRENPARFFKLLAKKAVLFFDAREISDVEDYVFGKQFNPILRLPWVTFAFAGPFFFLGLLALWKSPYRAPVYVWIISYLAGVLLFFINARYRLPLLPAILPVSAAGLFYLWEKIKQKGWGALVPALVVLGLAGWMTQARLVNTNNSRDYVNAGDGYLKKNDLENALPFYEKALKADPEYAKANLAMAIALTKLGRLEESKAYYEKTLKLDPENAQAYNNLGMWYDRQGRVEEAKQYFLKAVELEPGSALNHNNLGMAYGKLGQGELAVAEFEKAIDLKPDYARAYTNLALMRYRMGDKDEAARLFRKALEADPRFEEARKGLRLIESS